MFLGECLGVFGLGRGWPESKKAVESVPIWHATGVMLLLLRVATRCGDTFVSVPIWHATGILDTSFAPKLYRNPLKTGFGTGSRNRSLSAPKLYKNPQDCKRFSQQQENQFAALS